MKSGLGLYKKYRFLFARYNLLRFRLRKTFIGFDMANQFIQRVDKISLQHILKKHGAIIGNNCDIETGLIFHNCKNYANLNIGNNCHIGKNCFFDLKNEINIGNNVVISMQCTFITHIDINRSPLSKIYPAKQKKVIVEDNCYIGANTTILMGIKLEKSSFIAANSLVNINIIRKTMFGGVPVKFIKEIK